MKKFISLFVIAAVLAFAGMAFADDGDISGFAAHTSTPGNMGVLDDTWAESPAASMDVSAPLYYFKTAVKTDITASFVGTGATTNQKTGSTTAANAVLTPAGLDHNVTLANTALAGDNITTIGTLTIPGVSLDMIPAGATAKLDNISGYSSTAGLGQTAVETGVTKVANLTLNFTPVEFCVVSGDAKIAAPIVFDNSRTANVELAVSNDQKEATLSDVELAVVNPDGTLGTLDTANVPLTAIGAKAGIAAKKITIEKDTAYKAGSVKLAVVAKKTSATAKIGVAEIAGLNSPTDNVVLATVDIKVEVAQSNKASFLPGETTTISLIDEDIVDALVISTDISTDKVAAANSDDLKLYINDTALNAKSFDVALAAGGYTFALPVATQLDLVPIAGASVYVTDDKAVMTNKLTLSIAEKPAPAPTPAGNVKQPTTEIISAVSGNTNVDTAADISPADVSAATAIMASENIKFAASLDVNGKLTNSVAASLVGAQAEDVTPLQAVSADVATSKIAMFPFAINGSSLIDTKSYTRGASPDVLVIRKTKANGTYANFTYAKTADDIKDGSFMIFNASGTSRELNLVSGDRQYTLVVFVQDRANTDNFDLDNRAGKVLDPVVAVKARPGGSSSSGCDLGFGLVAVAGLAALALRKRSK